MIEYKSDTMKEWHIVSKSVDVNNLTFVGYTVRIGPQIFTHHTQEFREAVQAEQIWEKLRA